MPSDTTSAGDETTTAGETASACDETTAAGDGTASADDTTGVGDETDRGRPCPQCGAAMVHRHCEYVCPNHGVVMDCSDTFYS